MNTWKAPLAMATMLVAVSACAVTQGGREVLATQARNLEAEKAHSVVAASSMPGVWLGYVVDQSGPNAGINSSVYIHNDNDSVRQVRYERTKHGPSGGSSSTTVPVQGKGKTWIGYTCAFDVSYSTLCGSAVTYAITN